jgi:DNA-binding transcriptional ArsR family regulator
VKWLGRDVGEGGVVLYLDFELDAAEQRRRVYRLARAEGLERVPDSFRYMSALGHPPREAFRAALEECKEHDVKLLIVDSLGIALQGDAEAARDVIGFFQRVLEPFRAIGVTVLLIDHQSRLQAGERYQNKGAFGSVYKSNLARSVIQAEATERGGGTLTVRLRQKKHNFGELATPFEVKLAFSEEMVTLEAVELAAAELADEGTLNAKERIKLALRDGPKFPADLAEATGLALKTVKNRLGELRRAGIVEASGHVEDQAEEVSLVSPPLYRDGDRDTYGEEAEE